MQTSSSARSRELTTFLEKREGTILCHDSCNDPAATAMSSSLLSRASQTISLQWVKHHAAPLNTVTNLRTFSFSKQTCKNPTNHSHIYRRRTTNSIATMSSLSRRACYKCGNVGHYAEVCTSTERLCYNCKQPGHESNQCPHPRTTDSEQCTYWKRSRY